MASPAIMAARALWTAAPFRFGSRRLAITPSDEPTCLLSSCRERRGVSKWSYDLYLTFAFFRIDMTLTAPSVSIGPFIT